MIVLGFFHNDRDLSATLYQKETSDNFLGENFATMCVIPLTIWVQEAYVCSRSNSWNILILCSIYGTSRFYKRSECYVPFTRKSIYIYTYMNVYYIYLTELQNKMRPRDK